MYIIFDHQGDRRINVQLGSALYVLCFIGRSIDISNNTYIISIVMAATATSVVTFRCSTKGRQPWARNTSRMVTDNYSLQVTQFDHYFELK